MPDTLNSQASNPCSFCSLRLAGSYYRLREDAKILTSDFFLIKDQDWQSEWVKCWKLRLTCFFSIFLWLLCTAGRRGGGGGGGKREAEWVEEWKERRIEAVWGCGSKRVNPEQVNTAVDRHGLSGCLPPVAPVLRTRVPRSQWGQPKLRQSGQARPAKPGERQVRWVSWALIPAG